jgi:hypothetical protein
MARDMAVEFLKDPPRYVKEWASHRSKKLGGKTSAASGVRRIDPQTGEVIETISRSAIEKMGPPKLRREPRAQAAVNLEAQATAILRKNPEKKKS